MYNMFDLFAKHTRIISVILVWGLVLINIFFKNKNIENKYNKMKNIKNHIGFAVTFTLFAFLSKVIDKIINSINLSNNMFVLNWFTHILLVIIVLEIFKHLFDIVDRALLILYLPVTLVITGGAMKKTVVSLISNNMTVFLFVLSILSQAIVGMGLFMFYTSFIYERNIDKEDETY